ncbi:hypothetical protein IJJ97_03960, partial [bacterium]|nr:hypothetical protein [bacterium]
AVLKSDLEKRQYTPEEIEFAFKDVTEDDWNKQAVKVMNSYINLKSSSFKKDHKDRAEKFMIENLKLTPSQAKYAIEHADWKD